MEVEAPNAYGDVGARVLNCPRVRDVRGHLQQIVVVVVNYLEQCFCWSVLLYESSWSQCNIICLIRTIAVVQNVQVRLLARRSRDRHYIEALHNSLKSSDVLLFMINATISLPTKPQYQYDRKRRKARKTYPYNPRTSAKIRIRTMTTNTLPSCTYARTQESPTMPIA